jgi:hypothetical protein
MKRSGIVVLALLSMLLAGTSVAGPPLDGTYQSTDLGGSVLLGRYSEAYPAANGSLSPGTTINSQSWDGATLGTQWMYFCAVMVAPPTLMEDNVDANGNGNRTYQKEFVGGYFWLSGTGPWANSAPDYPGMIDTYTEFETIQYEEWDRVAAVTNVQAVGRFDDYLDVCLNFAIGNGSEVGSTDFDDPVPTDYPPFLDPDTCDPTGQYGGWWDFFTITLSITGCSTPVYETTWGAVKARYTD